MKTKRQRGKCKGRARESALFQTPCETLHVILTIGLRERWDSVQERAFDLLKATRLVNGGVNIQNLLIQLQAASQERGGAHT